jgi:acetyl-CoA carboxylase carboxyl transferase subunit beta
LSAPERVKSLVEAGSFEEMDANMTTVDVLGFSTAMASYKSKLVENQKKTGRKEAVVTGLGKMGAHRVALGVLDFQFLAASMGSVVGEKLTRLIERATEKELPVIIVSASGGARMYEGTFSLMQMAKTCGARAYHAKAKLPFISVLAEPTYGGVTASFATVGDLIIAEPGAMIGFAGPRVVKDATQAELPAGFQTAEFLLDHGLIDAIVPRKELKKQLIEYLDFLTTGMKAA